MSTTFRACCIGITSSCCGGSTGYCGSECYTDATRTQGICSCPTGTSAPTIPAPPLLSPSSPQSPDPPSSPQSPPEPPRLISPTSSSPPPAPLLTPPSPPSQTVGTINSAYNSSSQIFSSNVVSRDQFGSILAVDRAGVYVFIGAPKGNSFSRYGCGAVFVYELDDSSSRCIEIAQIAPQFSSEKLQNSMFGAAIAVDGNRALIGAPGYDGGRGAVFALYLEQGVWELNSQPIQVSSTTTFTSPPMFGSSVGMFRQDMVVGEPGKNSVHVYEMAASALWSYKTQLSAPNSLQVQNFGAALAITQNRIVASSGGQSPVVHVFGKHNATSEQEWTLDYAIMHPTTSTAFGHSLATDGDRIVVGDPDALIGGAAHIYERSGRSWIRQQQLNGSGPDHGRFGESVSIIKDRVAVGAPGTGAGGEVYVFEKYLSNSWELGYQFTQKRETQAAEDVEYGLAVDQSVHALLVGTGNRIARSDSPFVHGAYMYQFTQRAVAPALVFPPTPEQPLQPPPFLPSSARPVSFSALPTLVLCVSMLLAYM